MQASTDTEKLYPPDELRLMRGEQHPVDVDSVRGLADSIRVVGQLHAVHVRLAADDTPEILSGRRRWMACAQLGIDVRCRVHRDCDDETADKIRVIENEHRQDPSAYETAVALRRLKNVHGWTHEQVADHTGMGVSRVKEYLAVFRASDRLLDTMRKQRLPIGLAVELVRYERLVGEAAARSLVRRADAGGVSAREVRALRKRNRTAPSSSRAPASPWERIATRAERLYRKDEAGSRGDLEALVGRLAALLEAPATPQA